MRTLRLLFMAIGASVAIGSFAQAPTEVQQAKLEKNHQMIFFGEGNADTTAYARLISNFYIDQFRHAQDPRAPYFLLMSRNGQMAMGVGGTITPIAAYGWDNPISGMDFSPYSIPMTSDPAGRNLFQTSIGQSALFFTIFGTDQRFGNYKLYIKAKFSGPGNSFKLSKAYATVGDWTLGYAYSTFVDPNSQPSTVETAGPNSETGDTRFLLRWMHDVAKNFTIALSAENPSNEQFESAQYKTGTTYIPNFAAFLQYGSANQHIRLSGVVMGMRYRNLVEQANRYATGWGVNLSTVFRPVDPVTIYAAANTGQGIGSMVNDLSCGNNDLVGISDKPGEMRAARSYGWYAAVQYNFSPSVFSTVMFSQERILPGEHAIYGPDQYKYGLYGTANVFWNITPRCQLGAEFNVGKRANMDGEGRLSYRTGVMAQFSF